MLSQQKPYSLAGMWSIHSAAFISHISFPFRLFRDDTDAGKKLLYLTPVRRTSRRSRSICPQLVPKGETCFTSPSELSEREGYDGVEVLRNEALEVLQPSRPLVGANCSQRGAELES